MIKALFQLIWRLTVILLCMLFLLRLFFYMPRIQSMFYVEN
jgi:hypothetical protein